MCIIIIKQKNKKVKESTLYTSSVINPDGLGIVWLDTFEVTYHNSKEYKKLLTDRPYIAHFRYATVGKVNKANTHPFICGKQEDELLMMMNGTIKGLGNKEKTDSKALAEMLGDIPRKDWKEELEQYESRFVTINIKKKSFQIYNKDFYTFKDGVWYSKDNVLQDNLIAVYGTLKKGHSNYYGHLGGSTFLGSGKTKDKYPLIIKGLPFLVDKKGVGHNVEVDVFKVSDSTLANLDILEGHPRWYIRREIPILVGKVERMCWVYFNPKIIDGGDVFHKTFPKQFTFAQKSFDKTPKTPTFTGETKETCTQLSYWDSAYDEMEEIKVEFPVCIDCYNDIQSDGYGHYHCDSCDAWFTENEVSLFN